MRGLANAARWTSSVCAARVHMKLDTQESVRAGGRARCDRTHCKGQKVGKAHGTLSLFFLFSLFFEKLFHAVAKVGL